MENCPGCGAPHDGSKLICVFCGISVQDIDTADAELKAVKELAAAAQAMLSKKGAFFENVAGTLGSQLGAQTRKDKVLTFWQNAFVPRSFDAQDQLLTQILALTDTQVASSVGIGGFNWFAAMKAQGQNDMNDAMLGFADRLMGTMKLQHTGSSEYGQRLVVAEKRLGKIRSTAKGKWRKTLVLGFLAMGLAVGSSFYMVGKMGDMTSQMSTGLDFNSATLSGKSEDKDLEASCKGESEATDCDDICRFSACAALCEEQSMDWACDARDLLKMKRKKAKEAEAAGGSAPAAPAAAPPAAPAAAPAAAPTAVPAKAMAPIKAAAPAKGGKGGGKGGKGAAKGKK